MSMNVWCKHFNGTQHAECRKGIRYNDIRDDSGPGMVKLPCFSDGGASTICPHFEHYTQAEIDAVDRQLANALSDMLRFEKRETEDCPHCGQHVDRLQKVGRCVYALPCDCRLWQGQIPEDWKS